MVLHYHYVVQAVIQERVGGVATHLAPARRSAQIQTILILHQHAANELAVSELSGVFLDGAHQLAAHAVTAKRPPHINVYLTDIVQGIGDLYRIYSEARRDGIEFNLASIPSDVSETSNKPFDQNYMASLFDRGYALASHHYTWSKGPPGFESFKQSRN